MPITPCANTSGIVPCPDCGDTSGIVPCIGTSISACSAYDATTLKQIRAAWKMSQSAFAELLGVSLRSYQGWEQGRKIPGTISRHAGTIQKLRQIYEAWDQFATPLAGTEEFDAAVDAQEKLWSELFPELNRL